MWLISSMWPDLFGSSLGLINTISEIWYLLLTSRDMNEIIKFLAM